MCTADGVKNAGRMCHHHRTRDGLDSSALVVLRFAAAQYAVLAARGQDTAHLLREDGSNKVRSLESVAGVCGKCTYASPSLCPLCSLSLVHLWEVYQQSTATHPPLRTPPVNL